MHYFGIPRHTQSMIAYKIRLSISGISSEKLHRGNVVNMPFLHDDDDYESLFLIAP